jgi:hypothetical protein
VRSLGTSLLALIAPLFVGAMIAQVLAVETGAQEEWILVFAAAFLVQWLIVRGLAPRASPAAGPRFGRSSEPT